MTAAPLPTLLAQELARADPGRLCVAYSGGGDSTALLHALAQLPQAHEHGLRALHVDHGLHADSARWSEHCRRFCDALGVPIEIVRARVAHERGEGLEAAARHARHAAFASVIQPGEWLALAHHRDDQVETVLLKLLRGAGAHGLGGMRERRALGHGTLWRPLLELPRSALRDYLKEHRLDFIDDPSNANTRFSRNYLRAEILPGLRSHWPQTDESIARSAGLCRDATEFIDREAEAALARLHDLRGGTLDAHGWSALPPALRMPVLENWLHAQGLSAPPFPRCAELQRQIRQARTDREPRIAWPDGELRLWRGALHVMPPLREIPRNWEAPWDGARLQLPGNAGELWLRATGRKPDCTNLPTLRVRFRRGGERLRPAGDPHTRELRDLFQRDGVPPWQRGRIPLVFDGDELIAVGNLWISAVGKALFDGIAAELVWQRQHLRPHAPIDSSGALR